jgi:hypothetical protein
MSFYEFAVANDEQLLLEHLESFNTAIPKIFEDKMATLFKNYLITGGMPEVVAKWIDTKDTE